MSNILRVILTFQNPTKREMHHLCNLISVGTTLTDEQIYIASPSTNLLHYSNDRLQNIKLTQALRMKKISPEFVKKFNEDYINFTKEFPIQKLK
jgi:hypothetical protein